MQKPPFRGAGSIRSGSDNSLFSFPKVWLLIKNNVAAPAELLIKDLLENNFIL